MQQFHPIFCWMTNYFYLAKLQHPPKQEEIYKTQWNQQQAQQTIKHNQSKVQANILKKVNIQKHTQATQTIANVTWNEKNKNSKNSNPNAQIFGNQISQLER